MEFPAGLFTDVRYESVYSTTISFENGVLKQNKTALEQGAFIRVFDGRRWYYSATTDLNSVQEEIDGLAAMAAPNPDILRDPVVKRLEANRDVCLRYQDTDVSKISNVDKVAALERYLPVVQELDDVQMSVLSYFDTHTEKHTLQIDSVLRKIDALDGSVYFCATFCSSSAIAVPASAMNRLSLAASMNELIVSTCLYHWSVKPLPGKTSAFVSLKEAAAMTSSGPIRKT